jgi:hypothetical protein
MAHAYPGLRPGLSSARPYGTRFRDGRSHADSLAPEVRLSFSNLYKSSFFCGLCSE